MATLVDVVDQLQEQNKSLNDVSTNIKDLLAAEIQARKDAQNALGDEAEQALEEKRKKALAAKSAAGAPRSLASGFAQGTGLAGMGDAISSFLGNAGTGLLGGATLGGLVGKGIGRLFFPAMAAFFSAKYLNDWVDPLVDKITGDDATFNVFGNEVDGSVIASGLGGALALLFGKDLIAQAAKGVLGVGTGRAANLRKIFVRRFGLGAIGLSLAGTLGDAIEDASGSATAGSIASEVVEKVSLAMMFLPGGIMIRALAGIGFAGISLVAKYIETRRERMLKETEEVLDKKMEELPGDLAAGKTAEAAATMNAALNSMQFGYDVEPMMLNKAKDAISQMDPGVQKENFSKIVTAMETPKPPTISLDTVAATDFSNVQAAAQIAALDETIMKRLGTLIPGGRFDGMTRNQQEAIVGNIINSLGLATSGVSASQLAVDFLDKNYKKPQVLVPENPRLEMGSYDPMGLAQNMFRGYTGQNITINNIDNSDNSQSTVSKGEVNNLMKQELNSIDAFHLNNYMHNDILSGFR